MQLFESKIDWVHPKDDNLHREHGEVSTQLNDIVKHEDSAPHHVKQELEHLKDFGTFEHAIQNGKIKKIKRCKAKNIMNHTWEESDWDKLEPSKRKRVEQDATKGKLKMPIILQHKETKARWLLAHNTTMLYTHTKLKKPARCLIIKY